VKQAKRELRITLN